MTADCKADGNVLKSGIISKSLPLNIDRIVVFIKIFKHGDLRAAARVHCAESELETWWLVQPWKKGWEMPRFTKFVKVSGWFQLKYFELKYHKIWNSEILFF